jgi:hypothetical protein
LASDEYYFDPLPLYMLDRFTAVFGEVSADLATVEAPELSAKISIKS